MDESLHLRAMLKTTGLTYRYRNGSSLAFPDIHFGNGDHWLILGASGSGKTTFLQLLAGLRSPSSGKVFIGDTDLSSLKPSLLDTFRGQHIGLVFQQPHFIHALSVEENVLMAQQLAGRAIDRSKVRELLSRLGLGSKFSSRPHRLSQGEQQRVAIARALVNTPDVILADEPTSALDDNNTNEVIALLEEQASVAKSTLVVVTHDQRLKDQFENRVAL